MAGKVFVSCGQRPPDERRIAFTIKNILEEEFGLTCYLAFKIQSLGDIMTITNELRSADYYLFVDFLRRGKFLRRLAHPEDLAVSLFTHQELALAHNLGYGDIIALQQKGAPLEGFIRYVLSNPEPFTDESDLFEKVVGLVRSRGWSRDYSRNLVLASIGFSPIIQYADRTGASIEKVWQARVHNKRPDVAAVGSVCILDYLVRQSDGLRMDCPDRSYLKWAGQAGYDRTILPRDFGDIDLFSIRMERRGLFLHSLLDAPREPIVEPDGKYRLFYKLFSQGFPLLEFHVDVDLTWNAPAGTTWDFRTTATM